MSLGRAPQPEPGYDPVSGRKRWDAEKVKRGKLDRRGQGYRTDMHKNRSAT